MRKGFNPNKDKKTTKLEYYHQVIIPVYIPNDSGYFKDSFKILKLTIDSLLKTSHKQTFITIVNNGSNEKVSKYFENLYNAHKIHELIQTVNIGKLNAILKGLSGNNFPLITISDADVMFLNDWQKETYNIFETFPRAGFVSPCPSSKSLKRYTYNILIEKLFSNKLKFTKVKNPKALERFAHSIGNTKFYNQYHLDQYLTITKNDNIAVIGGGHFVGTYRGEIFKNLPQKFSEFSLGGTSENDILDAPVVDKGFWRLSTTDNYVYHLGNTFENWMSEISFKDHDNDIKMPFLEKKNMSKTLNNLKKIFFSLFLSRSGVWSKFLAYKGLNKKAINDY